VNNFLRESNLLFFIFLYIIWQDRTNITCNSIVDFEIEYFYSASINKKSEVESLIITIHDRVSSDF